MINIRSTTHFDAWLHGLKDRRAAARIVSRLERLEGGLFGDVKFFETIGELRIDYGPGYRIYFVKQGQTIIVLLCGGNKKTQKRDIDHAKQLAKELKP